MILRGLGFAKPKTMKVLNINNTRGSSSLSNRNAVFCDQAVDKNHGNPSLLISFFEPSKEGEDDRNTLLQNARIIGEIDDNITDEEGEIILKLQTILSQFERSEREKYTKKKKKSKSKKKKRKRN